MDRVLEQKLKKVLEARTDTPAMLEALQAIAAFYGHERGGNTAEARKNLRQDLEKQNMAFCDNFVSIFTVLRARLDKLEAHTASLEGHCHSVHARIDAAEESMSAFLGKARALQKQQAEVEGRAGQIQAFLEKFILSDAEVASLRHDPIDRVTEAGVRPFFAALERVQEIRLGCSQLVGSKHQRAGLEMLEALSEQQEAAFRRLHSWILQRFAGLERDDAGGSVDVEESDGALGLGLRTMRERPALFLHCQEALLQRRRDVVRRRFLLALTHGGGGPGMAGTPVSRPIDHTRFLSDICGWLHQTAALERELLLNLLGTPAPAPSSPVEGVGADAGLPEELSLETMLQGIMDGVAPLLKARLLQLLVDPASLRASSGATNTSVDGRNSGSSGSSVAGVEGQQPPPPPQQHLVLHFRLLNLLLFYDTTFNRGKLGLGGSQVAAAVAEARARCQELFEAGLRRVGEAAIGSPPAVPMDLGAAPVVQETGRMLGDILAVHAASLLPAGEEEEGNCGYAMDDVLAALIEPVLRGCRLGTEGLLDPSDVAVFMLNNASALARSLEEEHAAASPARDWLARETETWLDTLVNLQSDTVLERSGLGTLLERATAVTAAGAGTGAGAPLSSQPGLDEASVAQVMKGFYSGLFALPQFERLQSPSLRGTARQRTAVLIAEAHEKAHALLERPESGYGDRAKFLFHTPEQVRLLLDCD